jgi:hypothetical protein
MEKTTPIDILPEDVLLSIFAFYVDKNQADSPWRQRVEAWISLALLCQRWRSIVFGSSSSSNLQLLSTLNTPVRDAMDVWLALPLAIRAEFYTV